MAGSGEFSKTKFGSGIPVVQPDFSAAF